MSHKFSGRPAKRFLKSLLGAVMLPLGFGLSSKSVENFNDFRFHIHLHRERVVQLGLALAEQQSPQLAQDVVLHFLSLHDFAKTDLPVEAFNRYGYNHAEAPVVRLFRFFGVNPTDPQQRQELTKVIDDINTIDDRVAEEFTGARSLSLEEASRLRNIERVADLVDRSNDPIATQEFGRKFIPASEYLTDPKLIAMAQWLEPRYALITHQHQFKRNPTTT